MRQYLHVTFQSKPTVKRSTVSAGLLSALWRLPCFWMGAAEAYSNYLSGRHAQPLLMSFKRTSYHLPLAETPLPLLLQALDYHSRIRFHIEAQRCPDDEPD